MEFAEGMGISPKYIEKACDHFPSHSVEQLVNFLLENPMDNGTIPDSVSQPEETLEKEVDVLKTWNMTRGSPACSDYELVSAVVHLGKSVGSGHYVAYAKEHLSNGQRNWVYYNDDAVYYSGKPRLDKSYMLFLKKKSSIK